MHELRSWMIIAGRLFLYIPYRLGWRAMPTLLDVLPEVMDVLGRILGWHKYVRVRGDEHCPKHGPAVIVGNHMKLDDAWIMFRASYLGSGNGGLMPHFMMRDDFFSSRLLKNRFYDLNELTAMGGTHHVHRESVTLAQLKPFVQLLTNDQSFIMYPGRTRSRTGLFTEYREPGAEPGGVSFFVAQAQRRRPELRVPIVPLTRTYNPVNHRSALIFGPPLYLTDGNKVAQRALDYRLMECMGDLLEVNAVQALCAILYLRCLHGRAPRMSVAELEQAVGRVVNGLPGRYVDPVAQSDLAGEVRAALVFLQRHHMLRRIGDAVEVDRDAVLSCPEHDTAYKQKNPVKFLSNQLLHLPDAVAAVHTASGTDPSAASLRA